MVLEGPHRELLGGARRTTSHTNSLNHHTFMRLPRPPNNLPASKTRIRVGAFGKEHPTTMPLTPHGKSTIAHQNQKLSPWSGFIAVQKNDQDSSTMTKIFPRSFTHQRRGLYSISSKIAIRQAEKAYQIWSYQPISRKEKHIFLVGESQQHRWL